MLKEGNRNLHYSSMGRREEDSWREKGNKRVEIKEEVGKAQRKKSWGDEIRYGGAVTNSLCKCFGDLCALSMWVCMIPHCT